MRSYHCSLFSHIKLCKRSFYDHSWEVNKMYFLSYRVLSWFLVFFCMCAYSLATNDEILSLCSPFLTALAYLLSFNIAISYRKIISVIVVISFLKKNNWLQAASQKQRNKIPMKRINHKWLITSSPPSSFPKPWNIIPMKKRKCIFTHDLFMDFMHLIKLETFPAFLIIKTSW